MKLKHSIINLLLLAVLANSACTSKYDDYNLDPSGATQEEMERRWYNVATAMTGMQNWVIPTQANTCQFTDCLMGGSFGGYLADSNNGFNGKNFSTYFPEEHWLQVAFNDIIPEIFTRHDQIKNSTDDPIPIAVADIIKVISISRITDIYGPIPYSKIGEGGKINATYDSQEQVYVKMMGELDNAITVLTDHRTENFTARADYVYMGNVEKWIKLANSFKLRMAMRMAYVKPALAQAKAEEAVAHVIGPMTDNNDNAYMTIAVKNPFRIVLYEYNDGDSRISADIASYMNGYNDPRREKYFTESKFAIGAGAGQVAQNGYFGLRSGILIPGGTNIKLYSNMNIAEQDKLLWMNAAEVAFLRAEGALRGWNMGTPAIAGITPTEGFYKTGITLSFDQWKASGADLYMANATNRPETYVDPMGAFSYTGTTSSVTIKWDEAANNDLKMERIITQKWIANFPLGVESWSEFRRTGYPKLMKVDRNSSGGKVDSDKMARRLHYPQIEYTNNKENVTDAVSQYLKGPDDMGTDVWWAKK